jgi:hypothetical protein
MQLPPAVNAALDPNLLQASDGNHYRRDAQGQWRHDGEQATGQRALELELTRERLMPMLEQHKQDMTQIPAWQAPTQEHLNQQALQDAYTKHNLKPPMGEQLDAAYAAVQRTRSEQGLPERITSLALEADANGQRSQDSNIQHLQTGTDGAMRVAAITTAKEMEAIQSPSLPPSQAPEASAAVGPPNAAVNAGDRDDKRDDKQVVGPTTGLPVSNDFRDKNHPGHARYERMLYEVEGMEVAKGIPHGPNTSLIAAALTVKAEQNKFYVAEIVRMEPDGQISALKINPFGPDPKVTVDPKAVIAQGQSMEKSSELWLQARSGHYVSDMPAAERTQAQVKALGQMNGVDQALFEKIRQHVPSHISDDVVAKATLAAKKEGVLNVDQIDKVAMAGDNIAIKSRSPGTRAMTDANEPAAPMPETAKQTESFNQQQAIDQRLAHEQALAKKQEQDNQGPTMRMTMNKPNASGGGDQTGVG